MTEKTEQPTPKRLRDARKKGQVASSREIVSAALLVAVYVYFMSVGERYYDDVEQMILLPSQFYDLPFNKALNETFQGIFELSVRLVAPLLLVVAAVAIAANFLQIGALLAFESIKPDLEKVSPVQGFKRIFSMKTLMEAAKSVIKITLLSMLLYTVIKSSLGSLVNLPACDVHCIPPLLDELLLQTAIYSAIAFVIIAAADYVFQWFQHIKQLKMSKDEVKREFKEMEGDPLVKSKRRQLHQEMLAHSMVDNVRRSTVLVTNPTRLAIALAYEPGKTPLPVVLAKGEGFLARRMIEVARAHGVPVMENVPLARALHERGELDDYIPADLLEAVAEVLRWVRRVQASE